MRHNYGLSSDCVLNCKRDKKIVKIKNEEANKSFSYPHPILKMPSQPVERIDQEIHDILDDMTVKMKNNNGIGLAAPQIGISKRLITVFLNEKDY